MLLAFRGRATFRLISSASPWYRLPSLTFAFLALDVSSVLQSWELIPLLSRTAGLLLLCRLIILTGGLSFLTRLLIALEAPRLKSFRVTVVKGRGKGMP